jgi:hypothetical protein
VPIRRREKPLTPQEAIDLAKKELFPFWFGSEPLLAAVQTGETAQAFPLDSSFALRPWLLLFLDPTDLTAVDAFTFARFCAQRYEAQRLGVITFLRAQYSFLNADWIRKWTNSFTGQFSNSFIAALDKGGAMARSFQVQRYPALLLMNQGHVAFNRQENWFESAEIEIQRFYRAADPGLPLFPPLRVDEPLTANVGSLEFSKLDPRACVLSGKWMQEGDAMVTYDPQATVEFTAPASKLGIVAQAVRKMDLQATAEITVELNNEYGKAVVPAQDLHVDSRTHESVGVDHREKCRATLVVGDARIYSLFKNLPVTHREVRLRFPEAASTGVALYAVRFGK